MYVIKKQKYYQTIILLITGPKCNSFDFDLTGSFEEVSVQTGPDSTGF